MLMIVLLQNEDNWLYNGYDIRPKKKILVSGFDEIFYLRVGRSGEKIFLFKKFFFLLLFPWKNCFKTIFEWKK